MQQLWQLNKLGGIAKKERLAGFSFFIAKIEKILYNNIICVIIVKNAEGYISYEM